MSTPAAHVIFDLDGVLLDTEPLYTEATQRVCDPFGKTYDWELKSQVMGRGARVSAQLTIDTLGLPLTVDQYLDQRAVHLEALFPSAAELDGVPQLVAELARRGVPMAVATSSERRLCDLKLGGRPWLRHISCVLCADDHDVARPKPAPDIFLAAAAKLGASPATCLVFEDSLAGVEAALAAGMRVVAIPDPRLRAAAIFDEATLVIERYADLDLDQLGLVG